MEFLDICHAMAHYSPHAFLAINGQENAVQFINEAAIELLGKDSRPSLGEPINNVLPKGGGLPDCDLREIYSTRHPQMFIESEIKSKSSCYWSYYCWPVMNKSDDCLGLIIQILDATEMATFRERSVMINQSLIINSLHQLELRETTEKLNLELHRATEAKSEFLATMSHEIRTPLNSIMGFSELLSQPNQSDVERAVYADRIKRHSKLLLRLIDDILDLSKVEAGQLDVEKIEVNLSDLLTEVSSVMEHRAEEKGIEFSMCLDPGLPTSIATDPTRFKQILLNVIVNAVKFTTKGSVKVEVVVDQSEKKIRTLVHDTGEGLSQVQIQKIFKTFTQADSATTRKFGGTGLGLTLSRRLAQALSGDVAIVTSDLGHGSTFEITVAADDAKYDQALSHPIPVESLPQISLNGVRILVADDAADNRFLVEKILTWAGAEVDFAEDGAQAISKATSKPYDIILMDIQMPKVDGYTATMTLRRLGFRIPIIAMTAHAMRSDIERCMRAGCSGHFAKPISMVEVVRKIAAILEGNSNSPEWHQEVH